MGLIFLSLQHDCSYGKSLVEKISLENLTLSENTGNIIECCTNVEKGNRRTFLCKGLVCYKLTSCIP